MEIQEKFINYIQSRLRSNENSFLVSWNDKVRSSPIIYDISHDTSGLNKPPYALGYTANTFTSKTIRNKTTVSRITHAVIDIDKSTEIADYNKVYNYVTKIGLKPVLCERSGQGFHIIIPVHLKKEEEHYIKSFLVHLKTNLFDGIDTGVATNERFIRLPESMHYKGEPFKLETFEFNIPDKDTIIENSRIIQTFDTKKTDIVITTTTDRPDIFFSTLLEDKILQQYIADKENISKNSVLIKNLGIFVRYNSQHLQLATDFVLLCGHPVAELEGWIQQDVDEVNYYELKHWITDNKLIQLAELIKKQLEGINNIFDRYSFYYLEGDTSKYRYNLSKKGSHIYTKHDITQLTETIIFGCANDNIDIYDELDVAEFNSAGDFMSVVQRNNKVKNKLQSYLNESNITLIHGERYIPINEEIYELEGYKYLNTYKPPKNNAKENSFDNINNIIKHLTVDEAGYTFFIKWLAHIVQHPTIKLPTSFILMGTHGTGKGVFLDMVLSYVFGRSNTVLINQPTIQRGWGDFIKNHQIIFADEIYLKNKDVVERIKSNTSEKNITVDIKGKDSQAIENFSHWVFSSNTELPFSIDEGDRRYTVFNQEKKINTQLVKNLDPNRNTEAHKKEVEGFIYYLENLHVEYDEVCEAITTEAKNEIIYDSLPNARKFMEELRSCKDFKEFEDEYQRRINSIDREGWVSVEDLFELHKTWCAAQVRMVSTKDKFCKELNKKYELTSVVKKIDSIVKRRYNIEELMKK
jgi:hypothetical protein